MERDLIPDLSIVEDDRKFSDVFNRNKLLVTRRDRLRELLNWQLSGNYVLKRQVSKLPLSDGLESERCCYSRD